MSEKQQHTSASMREQMLKRYGDGYHHKHDKLHQPYRLHFRSHPRQIINEDGQEEDTNTSTGHIRENKLRKVRKRLDKGCFH